MYDGAEKIAQYGNALASWEAVWGAGLHQLLEWRELGGQGASTYVPLVDHRNSVVGLWSADALALVASAEYDPNGRMRVRDGADTVTCTEEGNPGQVCRLPGSLPFGFGSLWRSERTGLVQMGHRWYAPRLTQFVSHDPLGYVDSYNLYAYAAFDPINGWDPWGLATTSTARDCAATGCPDDERPQSKPDPVGPRPPLPVYDVPLADDRHVDMNPWVQEDQPPLDYSSQWETHVVRRERTDLFIVTWHVFAFFRHSEVLIIQDNKSISRIYSGRDSRGINDVNHHTITPITGPIHPDNRKAVESMYPNYPTERGVETVGPLTLSTSQHNNVQQRANELTSTPDRYFFNNTCNTTTAEILKAAGIPWPSNLSHVTYIGAGHVSPW